jgi:hypothetical protein
MSGIWGVELRQSYALAIKQLQEGIGRRDFVLRRLRMAL